MGKPTAFLLISHRFPGNGRRKAAVTCATDGGPVSPQARVQGDPRCRRRPHGAWSPGTLCGCHGWRLGKGHTYPGGEKRTMKGGKRRGSGISLMYPVRGSWTGFIRSVVIPAWELPPLVVVLLVPDAVVELPPLLPKQDSSSAGGNGAEGGSSGRLSLEPVTALFPGRRETPAGWLSGRGGSLKTARAAVTS